MTALAAPFSAPAALPAPEGLSPKQKAAVIVRFLMTEGASIPIDKLSHQNQSDLAAAMSDMRYVDRDTLESVLGEFAKAIDEMGLTFPQDLAEALTALDGHVSPQTAARLRKEAGVRQLGDPWEMIRAQPPEKLLPLLDRESTEISAVLLSKLPVSKAAELLSSIPGPQARRISYAVSLTAQVTPDAVDRIGLSIAAQFEKEPPRAFEEEPARRLGAILNVSKAERRETLLDEIEEDDAEFGEELRKNIFTFEHIADRIDPLDIPKIIRIANPEELRIALCFALKSANDELIGSADFILSNMSKRMADSLRDEVSDMKKVRTKAGEAAFNSIIATVFDLISTNELTLITDEEDED